MNLYRRATLLGSVAILAGCNGTSGINVTQAIADAKIIVTGLENIYRAYAILYPQTQQAAIEARLAAASLMLTKLSEAAPVLDNAATLEGIEAAINAVLDVLSSVPVLPAPVQAAILAARVLLPLIELVISQLRGKVAPSAQMRSGPTTMSPDQARATLRGVK
jgi:hypothetical protein